MARKPKSKLVRDLYQDRLPLTDFKRLQRGGPEHMRRLKAKLTEEVAELRESDYLSIEEYADVIEVLKCLAFFHNVDWSDVEDALFHKQTTKGKFVEGILLVNIPDDEENPDA